MQHETNSPIVGLAVICGALAMAMGAMTSLASALPEIGRATGATQGQLTWVIDGYALAFAGLLLPCGALGDRFGRRRALVWGLVIFALASSLGPIGADPTVLIASRLLAGVGAALIMPATLSLITTTMRGAAQERAVGIWISTATLGGALGLVFSGLVLEFSDWRAILYISATASALMALLTRLVGESADPERHPFDAVGAVLSGAAIGATVYGINEAPAHGWTSWLVWTAVAIGGLLAVVFTVVELRRRHPLLDVRIFRNRALLTGSLALVALFAVLFGFFFLIMQYLQLIEGKTPLVAGLCLLPTTITMSPLALAAPPLVARFGLRWITALGFVAAAVGMMVMAQLGDGDLRLYFGAVLIVGAAFGLCMTPATVAILRSVPESKQGVASAVNDAVREVGAALGIAVVGSLLATGYSRGLGPAVNALPEPARAAARASLGGALNVRAQLGPSAGPALAEAHSAFLSGLHAAFYACSIFTGVVVVAVVIAAPGRERQPDAGDGSRAEGQGRSSAAGAPGGTTAA
jgi:EmrB/QacA subfamily drug resistance transporter